MNVCFLIPDGACEKVASDLNHELRYILSPLYSHLRNTALNNSYSAEFRLSLQKHCAIITTALKSIGLQKMEFSLSPSTKLWKIGLLSLMVKHYENVPEASDGLLVPNL